MRKILALVTLASLLAVVLASTFSTWAQTSEDFSDQLAMSVSRHVACALQVSSALEAALTLRNPNFDANTREIYLENAR